MQDVRMTTYTQDDGVLTSDAQYVVGKVVQKIPVKSLDYRQIPYLDAWGRTESTGHPAVRTAENLLAPWYSSKANTSPMEQELLRLYRETGETGIFPKRAKKTITLNGAEKQLSAEEYVSYATLKGKLDYDLTTELVRSAEYKNMTPAEKAAAVANAHKKADESAKLTTAGEELLGMPRTVTEELGRLAQTHTTNSFVPGWSPEGSYEDPANPFKKYVLNSDQKAEGPKIYMETYGDVMKALFESAEYKAATEEEKLEMFTDAKSEVSKLAKAEMFSQFEKSGNVSVVDTDDEKLNRLSGAVADELVRLGGLSKDYKFTPTGNASEKYTDPSNTDNEYVLTDDQKDYFRDLYFENYKAMVLQQMATAAYQNAEDAGKAQLLADKRDDVLDATKLEFFEWLSNTGVKSTPKK
jgi:hypothetical protein